MAGLLTHEWIANLVLKKLSKRDFISKDENIDDYFFGAIAPDIRYINNLLAAYLYGFFNLLVFSYNFLTAMD